MTDILLSSTLLSPYPCQNFENHKVFVSLVKASQDRFALMFKLLAQNPEFNRQFGEKIPKQKRFPRPNSVWAILADEKSKENLNQWL